MTTCSTSAPNSIATIHLVIDLMLSCCFVNYSSETLCLDSNAMEGTIPTKIGQLTQLSEYPRDCCHGVLAQSLWASSRIHLMILMICFESLHS
jgi:hypothetical protein